MSGVEFSLWVFAAMGLVVALFILVGFVLQVISPDDPETSRGGWAVALAVYVSILIYAGGMFYDIIHLPD